MIWGDVEWLRLYQVNTYDHSHTCVCLITIIHSNITHLGVLLEQNFVLLLRPCTSLESMSVNICVWVHQLVSWFWFYPYNNCVIETTKSHTYESVWLMMRVWLCWPWYQDLNIYSSVHDTVCQCVFWVAWKWFSTIEVWCRVWTPTLVAYRPPV